MFEDARADFEDALDKMAAALKEIVDAIAATVEQVEEIVKECLEKIREDNEHGHAPIFIASNSVQIRCHYAFRRYVPP